MQKKQVAVLDVGSSKITAVIGERGINKTFIVKARRDFPYEGFSDGEFFELEQLKRTIHNIGEFITNSMHGKGQIYVGVPSGFTFVTVKDSQISFAKKKKIDESDISTLFDGAFVLSSSKVTLINRSAIVYELDDYRRLSNPIGEQSEILKAKLSFITCSNYFIDIFKHCLNAVGINQIEFISTDLAEAMFLLEAETRDRIAIIIDVGYIASSFSLIQGDGILYQDNFSYGGGYITACLSERYGLEFDLAEELKRKINLCSVNSKATDIVELSNGEFYNEEEAKKLIIQNLDYLCETISDCMDKSGYVIPEYVQINVTGGGIPYIRGAKEHIANRLGCSVNALVPKIPLMEKPTESSLYSLLDIALG